MEEEELLLHADLAVISLGRLLEQLLVLLQRLVPSQLNLAQLACRLDRSIGLTFLSGKLTP